jgi:hypothetical protein
MQEPNGLSPAQRELEAALRSLAPAPAHVDPLAAAFAAGQRSTRRQVRFWQGAATVIAVLGASLWLGGPPRDSVIREHDPSRPMIAAPPPPRPLSDQSVASLQQAVRTHGLDGLPSVSLPSVQITRAQGGGLAYQGEL